MNDTMQAQAQVQAAVNALVNYSGELLADQFTVECKRVRFARNSSLASAHSVIIARATGPWADVAAAKHALTQLPYVQAIAINHGHEVWVYLSQ